MNNQETAQIFKKMAAVFLVLDEDFFRIRAYQNAAIAIENLSEPIEEIWRRNRLTEIPGIGPNLQQHLEELFSTGRVKEFDRTLKKVPAGMFSLMTIRGIGPKTSYKIAKKFKLVDESTAIARLKELVDSGELLKIKSFKQKTLDKIAYALKTKVTSKEKRLLLADALPVAMEFIEFLLVSPLVKDAQPLGSLRRRLATVGDIDLAFTGRDPIKAMHHALSYPQIAAVITKGDKTSHVKLRSGYEVDLKAALPEEWGSLLQHYTGSKLHNIHLRTICKEKGLSLSEYGIKKGKKTHTFTNEVDFYKFIGLEYIPPEMREDKGEIELATKKKLPKVIDLDQIKGDLHLHDDFQYSSSHDLGDSDISEIAKKAKSLGYEYIGISDHNPKFTGLTHTEKKKIILSHQKYLKGVRSGLKILHGMEVDIRPDGTLAIEDDLLELLDYAIVSIHSGFDMTRDKNTQRIISALNHSKALILGHPTGRMLGNRESIEADWGKILDFCHDNHKIVEINASPFRLDLPEDLIRMAAEKKVKMIINTDSHDKSQMNFMKYGVWQARRGWAKPKDIVNTFSLDDLQAVLNLS